MYVIFLPHIYLGLHAYQNYARCMKAALSLCPHTELPEIATYLLHHSILTTYDYHTATMLIKSSFPLP